MSRDIKKLRNIGIVAHIDAGKTTLTERMLFYAHFVHRVGSVDEGTTVTDYDPEEQERGITINAATVTFPWKDVVINLIDTPGHVDFTAEVERSLRVLDGAIVVFSAREGVEAQSETVWHQADKYRVPRLAFINKMDREGADFFRTLQEIRERLGANPVPLTLPVGAGPAHFKDPFRAVIDLVTMKMLTFTPESDGSEIIVSEIPPEECDRAAEWRARLLDELSLHDDELTEKLLADEPVEEELLHRVIRRATIQYRIVPVFCGSALQGIGVQPVMDGVWRYLPSPQDLPPAEGEDPEHPGKKIYRKPDPKEPFSGLVFKIQVDRHGELYYVRIYSGQLKANSRVLNPGKGKKENVPQLWRVQADRREQIPMAEAGDIVGIVGLRYSVTGDTLCDPKHPILFEPITFPETVISMAIEPESSADRKKLTEVLQLMKKQDPTFDARELEETGQTIISGMGELHLEVLRHRLEREFRLNVRVYPPRVSYRETVEKPVEVTGVCHRNIGGQNLFAEVQIRMERWEQKGQPILVTAECGDALPPAFLKAVLQVLQEKSQGTGLLGFPLTQLKITVLGGKTHETDSNEVAFQIAAADAFEKALREAGSLLLEPIMRLEVVTPEEYLGDFVADLQRRRGNIEQTFQRGNMRVIEALVPMANLFGYSSAMRTLSQGRASYTMEPHSYAPAPAEVLQGMI
jgi:elongation factor G